VWQGRIGRHSLREERKFFTQSDGLGGLNQTGDYFLKIFVDLLILDLFNQEDFSL
jgi:hypothetical protein